MEEKNRRVQNKKSEAQQRRREYYEACKRLRSQCFLTYIKVLDQKQKKKQYRGAFLETPGIFSIVQQLFGFENSEFGNLDPEEFMMERPYLEVQYGRLFERLEELKKKAPKPAMTERQYAYNLNLDWNRMDSNEKKRLRRRLLELSAQEEEKLAQESKEEEYLLLKRLEKQLSSLDKEAVMNSFRKLETKHCKEDFLALNNRLREVFLKENVHFLDYTEADQNQQEQWFQEKGEGGVCPCVAWKRGSDNALALLLQGRGGQ